MKETTNSLSLLDSTVSNAAENVVAGNFWSEEQEKKFLQCEIDMQAQYPPNEFLFSVDDVPVLTRADIHTIGAKQKGGKTSFIGILMAAMLGGQWNRIRCLVQDASILYIDTEMKQVDTQQLGMKAARMANTDAKCAAERIHLVNFRPLTPQEMKDGIRYFIQKYKPIVVFIDGVVDLCANFNDVEASQKLVLDFLMKTAEEEQCAFINVLHTNKTDGYTELRGHLGAFFEQKGVTVIKCEKDDASNIVSVKFPTHRYAPVPEFHFTFDDEGVPVPADDMHQKLEDARQQSREEQRETARQALYEQRSKVVVAILREKGGSMERRALLDEAMYRLARKGSVVKNLLKQMLASDNPVICHADNIVRLC